MAQGDVPGYYGRGSGGEMRRGSACASEEIFRLHVKVAEGERGASNDSHRFRRSGPSFETIVEGTAASCFQALEVEVLKRFKDAGTRGFRLHLAKVAGAEVGPVLRPSDLYQTFLWNGAGSLVELWAELLAGQSLPAPASSSFLSSSSNEDFVQHGAWVHQAACIVQRCWRWHRRYLQRVDVEDCLQGFALLVHRQGMKPLQYGPLMTDGARMKEKHLQLVVAFAACTAPTAWVELSQGRYGSVVLEASSVFRWIEARCADFALGQSFDFQESLAGLTEYPRCAGALREVIKAFMLRLSCAFPWLVDTAFLNNATSVAIASAGSVTANVSQVQLSGQSLQDFFASQVHSDVMSWVVEAVEEVIRGHEHFMRQHPSAQDLATRISEMPCFAAAVRAFSMIEQSQGERSWLVRLEARGTRASPLLLLPLQAEQHFGGVLRSACSFFKYEYANLFTKSGCEPLPVEATPHSLQAHGVMLSLVVHSYRPQTDSFERALLDVAKSIGSKFQLDRESRVLRLPLLTPKVAAFFAQRAQQDASTESWGDLGDVVIMPASYKGESQYYHFYNHDTREFVSVRCSLATVTDWLKVRCGESKAPVPREEDAADEVSVESLFEDLEDMRRQVSSWMSATVSCSIPQAFFDILSGSCVRGKSRGGARQCSREVLALPSLTDVFGRAAVDAEPSSAFFPEVETSHVVRAAVPEQPAEQEYHCHFVAEPLPCSLSTVAEETEADEWQGDEEEEHWLEEAEEEFEEEEYEDDSEDFDVVASSDSGEQCDEDAEAESRDYHEEPMEPAEPTDHQAWMRVHAGFFCGVAGPLQERQCGTGTSEADTDVPTTEPHASDDDPNGTASRPRRGRATNDPDGTASCHRASSSSGAPLPQPSPMTQLMPLNLRPEVVRPAVFTIAACSANYLTAPTISRWVARQVTVLAQGQLQMAPDWPLVYVPGVSSVFGGVTGAALGSVFGPTGAMIGVVAGTGAGGGLGTLFARPEVLPITKVKNFNLMAGDGGKMYLHHKEVQHKPGTEGMLVSTFAVASLRGVANLMAFSRGKMSGRDVGVTFVSDLADGGISWAVCVGCVKGFEALQLSDYGVVGHFSGLALQYPTPVLITVLGGSRLLVRCASYYLGYLPREQFMVQATFQGTSLVTCLLANVAGCAIGMSAMNAMLLTCAGHPISWVVYEAWRASRQKDVQVKLVQIAREIFGLSEDYTALELQGRWLLLARWAHPDKNVRSDARLTFAVFSLCREVLRDNLNARERPASLMILLKRLRASSFGRRPDLPRLSTAAGYGFTR